MEPWHSPMSFACVGCGSTVVLRQTGLQHCAACGKSLDLTNYGPVVGSGLVVILRSKVWPPEPAGTSVAPFAPAEPEIVVCQCESDTHLGELVTDTGDKQLPNLMTFHVPFCLMDPSNDPSDDPRERSINPLARRLLEAFAECRGIEYVSLGTYSLKVLPARMLPLDPIVDACCRVFQATCCPDFHLVGADRHAPGQYL